MSSVITCPCWGPRAPRPGFSASGGNWRRGDPRSISTKRSRTRCPAFIPASVTTICLALPTGLRTAVACGIPAGWPTSAKFHTSAGTGAKAPTLFQLYDPANGSPGLKPEESFGYDAVSRLTSFSGLNLSQTYQYDLVGNRLSLTQGATGGVVQATQPSS